LPARIRRTALNDQPPSSDPAALQASGRRVLGIERDALADLLPRVDEGFARACTLMLRCAGRVVVTGMGKSGHVARKIAATLASTGRPAFFVHPGEASHGDLGMITRQDVVIAISNSGETAEILTILPLIKRMGAPLIAMTGKPGSTLAASAEVHLDVSVAQEACPLNLAPTASTTATLAMGDALAVAMLEARGFTEEDFARSHPGGALGRRLLLKVADLMHSGERLPAVGPQLSLSQALLEMTRKGLGMTAVVDERGEALGVFTDGDLRRTIQNAAKSGDATFLHAKVADFMTRNPKRITREKLAVEALRRMEEHKITTLFVFESETSAAPVGIVHMHDLIKAGLS